MATQFDIGTTIKPDWLKCYTTNSWGDEIPKIAVRHPSKFQQPLLDRIVKHLRETDRLSRGDLVLDPCAGVGTGALRLSNRYVNWFGVEVQKKWVNAATATFAMHEQFYNRIHAPRPRIVLGDSRHLLDVLEEHRVDHVDAILTAPVSMSSIFDNGSNWGPGAHGPDRPGRENASNDPGYGRAKGQMAERQEQFWRDASLIVHQCFMALKPGGTAIWVVKDFCRKKKRFFFSGMWLALCRQHGFVLTCRHYAWKTLRQKRVTLDGEISFEEKSWKSMVTRINEKNGADRIDWEDVLCMRKP